MNEFLQLNLPSKETKDIGNNDTLKMEVEALKNCLRGIVLFRESSAYKMNEKAEVDLCKAEKLIMN